MGAPVVAAMNQQSANASGAHLDKGDLLLAGIRQAGQLVGESSLGIDVVELGGGDEGIDGRGAPTALIRRDAIMPGVWGVRSKSSTHFTLFPGGPRRSSATRSILIVGTLISDRKMVPRFSSRPG